MTLVYLAIAFTAGILTAHVLRSEGLAGCTAPEWLFPSLAASLLVALPLLRRHPAARLIAAVALFLVLGAWRYSANPFERCWTERDLPFYQTADGVWAALEGEVVGYPDVRDNGTRYQLAVSQVTVDGRTHLVRGRALVEVPRYPLFAYGDTLRAEGVLLAPPLSDDFDYRRYLAIRGIHSLLRRPVVQRLASGGGQPFWRVLYHLRARGAAIVDRIMPEPAAALANGMVLGIEGGISAEVDDAFKATGTSHLIVISGSNIALLAGALVAALGVRLPRRRAALVAAPAVLLYVLLVGADPPALRAGVMGLLGLGAIVFGRRGTAYVSLCAAGLGMLALNPLTLWDIGFQLSFMTSLGLILFSRPLSRAVLAALRLRLPLDVARRWTRMLEGVLVVTVAAQLAVLPLILTYFGRLSPISLLTNCLVLPVQPAVLAGGIASLLAGALWQPLGQLVATVPWLLLTYTVGIVRATAALPFASVETGRSGPLFVVGCYAVLLLVFALPRIAGALRRRPAVPGAASWVPLCALPLALSYFAWSAQPDGRLHVVFVPGERGEAAVVAAPGGRTAWVWDGRGDGRDLARATVRGGFLRGKPDVVLANCDLNPWPGRPCVDPRTLAPGTVVALAEGVHITRLASGGEPALLVTYGRFRTVLPATLRAEGQQGIGVARAGVGSEELPAREPALGRPSGFCKQSTRSSCSGRSTPPTRPMCPTTWPPG